MYARKLVEESLKNARQAEQSKQDTTRVAAAPAVDMLEDRTAGRQADESSSMRKLGSFGERYSTKNMGFIR